MLSEAEPVSKLRRIGLELWRSDYHVSVIDILKSELFFSLIIQQDPSLVLSEEIVSIIHIVLAWSNVRDLGSKFLHQKWSFECIWIEFTEERVSLILINNVSP
jgi:hypothetical protein